MQTVQRSLWIEYMKLSRRAKIHADRLARPRMKPAVMIPSFKSLCMIGKDAGNRRLRPSAFLDFRGRPSRNILSKIQGSVTWKGSFALQSGSRSRHDPAATDYVSRYRAQVHP